MDSPLKIREPIKRQNSAFKSQIQSNKIDQGLLINTRFVQKQRSSILRKMKHQFLLLQSPLVGLSLRNQTGSGRGVFCLMRNNEKSDSTKLLMVNTKIQLLFYSVANGSAFYHESCLVTQYSSKITKSISGGKKTEYKQIIIYLYHSSPNQEVAPILQVTMQTQNGRWSPALKTLQFQKTGQTN